MRFIFFIAFLFFWIFTNGQSSAIGLHIGNVPQCTKITENQTQDNTITSNQCYSLGLSYHRSTKKHLFFTFRIQYQNINEEVERNTKFIFNGGENQFSFTNITNRSQKEIILLPGVYWMIGEGKLKPIMGFSIPLSITGMSRENIFGSSESISKRGNGSSINTSESNNEIIQDGGVAIGLMADLGMSYQLNKRTYPLFSKQCHRNQKYVQLPTNPNQNYQW